MENSFKCLGCGCQHNGTFLHRFCSNSCQLVYRIRLRLGLHTIKG